MKNLLNKFLNLLHINEKITLQKAIDDNLTIITIDFPQLLNTKEKLTIYQINSLLNNIKVYFSRFEIMTKSNAFIMMNMYPTHNLQTIPIQKIIPYEQKDYKKCSSTMVDFFSKTYFVTTNKKEAQKFIKQLFNTYKKNLKTYLNDPNNQNHYYDIIENIKQNMNIIIMKIYGLHVQIP